MSMWGGRFEVGSNPLFKAFNDSLPVDHRLLDDDIAGSIAWARALEGAGVISADESTRLRDALAAIADAVRARPDAILTSDAEDVHSWVEAALIERVGDLGKKLHTGRSRNDQVATDLRLWTRRAITARRAEIRAARAALVRLAERVPDAIMPGYTHLQRAQPILLSHWCLAYFEMLGRDDTRFADADRRTAECPLGAGALAGTAYPIDRVALARDLGFDAPSANSLDAVSDRDFVLETLMASSLCAIHLSRLAEDLIFFNSGEAGFLELDDATASGSSLMPQKKNPDALELIRGKAGRLIGAELTLAVTLKGLPLAYNKDLQEDKPALFDAMDTLSGCLGVLPVVLDGLSVDTEATRRAAEGSYANATELADYLVGKGVPFRDAHDVAGRVVRKAMECGVALEALPLEVMAAIDERIEADVMPHLPIAAALRKRDVIGGTAPERVRGAVERASAEVGGEVG